MMMVDTSEVGWISGLAFALGSKGSGVWMTLFEGLLDHAGWCDECTREKYLVIKGVHDP